MSQQSQDDLKALNHAAKMAFSHTGLDVLQLARGISTRQILYEQRETNRELKETVFILEQMSPRC